MTHVRLFLAAMLLAAGAFVPAAPAAAEPTGPCTDEAGVTVIVDFQELGGGTWVGCAPQPVANGLDALTRAGFVPRTTARFPGFVCRINDQPGNDPCITASPANAYWSYWLASRGGQWCYSNLGAGARVPPPGSVEGWSFAKDKVAASVPEPRVAPPAALPGTTPAPIPGNNCTTAAASSQSPAPATSPPTAAPAAPPPAAPEPAPPQATSPPAAAGGGNPGAAAPPSSTAPRAGASRGTAPAGTPSSTLAAAPVADAPSTSTETISADATEPQGTLSPANPIAATGEAIDFEKTADESSPLPTIIGVVVVLGVGGAAAYLARRRRRASGAT